MAGRVSLTPPLFSVAICHLLSLYLSCSTCAYVTLAACLPMRVFACMPIMNRVYLRTFADGAFLGLVLEFSLPSSSYATMALREITKMDMSAEFQTSLNDAGTNNKQPPVATLPTSAVEAAATDEPEMKRIKQEGEIKREEESVTSGEPWEGEQARLTQHSTFCLLFFVLFFSFHPQTSESPPTSNVSSSLWYSVWLYNNSYLPWLLPSVLLLMMVISPFFLAILFSNVKISPRGSKRWLCGEEMLFTSLYNLSNIWNWMMRLIFFPFTLIYSTLICLFSFSHLRFYIIT